MLKPVDDVAVTAIGLNIENPKTMELPVAGYDVNIDGEKKNAEMLKDNSYDYNFGTKDSKGHKITPTFRRVP